MVPYRAHTYQMQCRRKFLAPGAQAGAAPEVHDDGARIVTVIFEITAKDHPERSAPHDVSAPVQPRAEPFGPLALLEIQHPLESSDRVLWMVQQNTPNVYLPI